MVHTLNIVEPIWPMLQNASETLNCVLNYTPYNPECVSEQYKVDTIDNDIV